MEAKTRVWTLEQLADTLGGTLRGPKDRQILRPVPAGTDDPHGITFAESEDYLTRVIESNIGVVLVPKDSPEMDVASISVDHPRMAFGRVLAMFQRPLPIEKGIHPTAVVSPDAIIATNASIGAFVVIESGASIGEGSKIYPFTYVGEGCNIGENVVIYPHVVLYQDVQVGDKSVIHSGAIIGADGFGFDWDSKDRKYRVKVPQVGSVEIGDNVEIGALTAIDRATAGVTVIGFGSKLDNLIQIAHNCEIGCHSVVAGQTVLAGSSKIGSRCDVGGQTAISDHVSVGDDILLGGRTGVTHHLTEPGAYWGTPAKPVGIAKRISAALGKLPQMNKTIRELERRLAVLEDQNK